MTSQHRCTKQRTALQPQEILHRSRSCEEECGRHTACRMKNIRSNMQAAYGRWQSACWRRAEKSTDCLTMIKDAQHGLPLKTHSARGMRSKTSDFIINSISKDASVTDANDGVWFFCIVTGVLASSETQTSACFDCCASEYASFKASSGLSPIVS